MDFDTIVETTGKAIEAVGVAVIVVGSLFSAALYGRNLLRASEDAYKHFRQSLGRSILLGLELLVAGDIVRTVAVTPTLESVAVLAVIVLIRTFLSFTLEVELSGRWPWQASAENENGKSGL